MKKILIIVSIALGAIVALSCVSEDKGSTGKSLGAGDSMPTFGTLNGYHGEVPVTINSTDFSGKKGLIAFFSSSCGDCLREMPKIQGVWDALKDDASVVIAPIARKESRQEVEAYWERVSFTMPYYLDTDRSVYALFADSYVPRFFFIDSSGVIRHSIVEETALDAADMVKLIEEME